MDYHLICRVRTVDLTRFSVAMLGAVAFAALAQVPDDASWKRTLEASRSEGKVVLYTVHLPAVTARLKSAFEKTFPGMVLEYNRIVLSGDMANKIAQERETRVDGADAVINAEIAWISDLTKKGIFKVPVGPYASRWPAAFRDSSGAPILALEPFVMAYNTNLLPGGLSGYRDLLRPELKGKISTTEPVATIVVAWYDWLEKSQGPTFLPALAAQGPRAYPGSLPATQALAAGEVSVAAFTVMAVLQSLIEQGAPVKPVFPSSTFGTHFSGGIVAWARRPNAAAVFMDFLMSLQGQAAYIGKGEMASPLRVSGSPDPSSISAPDLSPYTPEAFKAYREKWNALFRRK